MVKFRIAGLIMFFALFFTRAKSQDVLDKITDSCCKCLSSIDTSLSGDKLNMQAGLCMLKYANPYKKELKKKYNIDIEDSDPKSKLEFGKLVGMRMVTACPQMIMLLTKGIVKKSPASKVDEADNYLVGKVTELQKSQFTTVVIQDVNGRTQKLLWLQYFHNSELFKNLDLLKPSEMKFYYREMELYNPQLDDYMNYKVMTDMRKE